MIARLNENLYQETRSPDLHLVMERLTDQNEEFWHRVLGHIKNYSMANQESQDPTRRFMIAGYVAFNDSLMTHLIRPYEMWILFASQVPVTEQDPHPAEKIEMLCTVSTKEGALFTSHQGITRTINAVEGRLVKHPNLSIDLHRFGARVMKLLHPEKLFMINCPMPKMEQILIQALGKQNVHIGLDEDWLEKVSKGEDLTHYQGRISACGSNPLIRLGPNWSSFFLKDLQGNPLLNLNEEQMNTDYAWYFRRPSSLSNVNNIIAISLDLLAGTK